MYLKRLDEIRGFALFLVLFTHWLTFYKSDNTLYSSIMYGILHFLGNLWEHGVVHGGVVIFIVLSGFMIHLPRVNKKEFNLINFVKRRLIRILPIMYLGFFLGFIYSILHKSLDLADLWPFIYSYKDSFLLLYAFIDVKPPEGNVILVTVIVEIILYIQYGLFFKVFGQNKYFIFVLLLWGLLLYIYSFSLPNNNIYWHNHNLFTFSLYWIFGAFCAEITIKYIENIKKYFRLKEYLFLVFVHLYLLEKIFKGTAYNTLFLVSLTFFTILFFSTLENKRNSISLFSYLGTISYSLYIIHRPILLMYREYFKTDIISHIFVFFIIILCGIFVYKYVEKPFHLLARKYK